MINCLIIKRSICGLIVGSCIFGATVANANEAVTVESAVIDPWYIIGIPGIDRQLNLKNYFDRAFNYGANILRNRITLISPQELDRVLGELGLPDVGALSDELIGIGRTEIEAYVFGEGEKGTLNLDKYRIARTIGEGESWQILGEILEAELSVEAQLAKKAELEAISQLAQNTIEKAMDASSSNISQDTLKAIAAQNANQAILLMEIHRQTSRSISEQKLIRHGQYKEAQARERASLNEIVVENQAHSNTVGSMFEFSAILMPQER